MLEEIQLRKITYDKKFTAALVSKLIELQRKRVHENDNVLQKTVAETNKQVDAVQNGIDIKLKEGFTEALVIDAQLQGAALKSLMIKMNEIYKKMQTDLALSAL